MRIDLHMHSRYSDDGEFTPAELVSKCKEAGLSCMAIADHNCVRSVEEGRTAARDAGILYIPALEIDCVWRDKIFHLLAYGIKERDPFYRKIEDDMNDQLRIFSRKQYRKLKEIGLSVREELMRQLAASYYRPWAWIPEMFAEVLLSMEEYAEEPLLAPYRKGGARSDNPYVNFYWDFCSPGKPAYVPMTWPSLEMLIKELHERGVLCVLAHPGAYLDGKNDLFIQMMRELDLDGAEALSGYHTQEQTEYYYRTVKELGKIVTCGSDFHGKTKPAIRIGGIKTPSGMTEEELEEEIIQMLRLESLLL